LLWLVTWTNGVLTDRFSGVQQISWLSETAVVSERDCFLQLLG